MSLVTAADFTSKLYAEVITQIDREDNDLLQTAIDTAEDEVKASLSRFDTVTLFAATGDARSKYLIKLIMDIAVYEFSGISSANMNTELWMMRYDVAKKDLEKIETGRKLPEGWPLKAEPKNVNNKITVFSNRKRRSIEGL